MMDNLSGAAVNTVFELMADSRCRIVLQYLRDRVDAPVSYDSLIRHVAKVETDAWDGAVPPEYPDYVAGDLTHTVLPDLTHHGLIENDPTTGTVRYRGHALIDDALRLTVPTISA